MRLVVDANVLIAALMRDSTTRRLLVLGGHELHVPEYLLEEIAEHWEDLLPRSGLSADALKQVLSVLRAHVVEHTVADYNDEMATAFGLLGDRDLEDAPYVALALSLRADGIWTEDRELASVKGVRALRTADLVKSGP